MLLCPALLGGSPDNGISPAPGYVRHRAGRGRHRGVGQGLRRASRRPRRRRHRPRGERGRDLRLARPERSRQDDDGRDVHDPCDPDRGTSAHRRHRCRRRPARRASTHRSGDPVQHARPLVHRGREPHLPLPVLRMERARQRRSGPTSCSSSSSSRTAPRRRRTRCPAAWRSGCRSRGRSPIVPTCSSSTSRPRVSTRRAARALGGDRRAPPSGRDDRAHDALHGRGRPALRPARDRRPRQGARLRHARRP